MISHFIYHNHTNSEQVYKPQHHTDKRERAHTPNILHTINMKQPCNLTPYTDEIIKVSYMNTRHAQQNIRHVKTNNNKLNHQKTSHTSHLNITSFIIISEHTTSQRRSKTCSVSRTRRPPFELGKWRTSIRFAQAISLKAEQIKMLQKYFFNCIFSVIMHISFVDTMFHQAAPWEQIIAPLLPKCSGCALINVR